MITALSKIIKINRLQIVGVLKTDSKESYKVLTAKKKGNKIDIVRTAAYDTFEQLSKNIDLSIPVVLTIDGKGILNKEINFNAENDINWYKNIDFESIYHTSLINKNSHFISFCRKNIVADTTEKFLKQGFKIIDVYTGAFLSALLYSTINKERITSGSLILEFNNGRLSQFTKSVTAVKTETYTIGKATISSDFLPLYGTLVHFFIQSDEVTKTQNETLNTEEIIYKKAFHILGITMLAGFLISLLLSTVLIQYYSSKNTELKLQHTYSNKSYQLILDLEKEKEKKQQILKVSGFLSSKFLSFYSYEIIKKIPEDISLISLNIIPLNKEIKSSQKMGFEAKVIRIQGETFKESSFNQWMEQIKKIKWIEHFEIISFKKDKKNKSQFEIKISIKDV